VRRGEERRRVRVRVRVRVSGWKKEGREESKEGCNL
jgi:hypothetical protein